MSARDNTRIRSLGEEIEVQMAVDKIDSDHDQDHDHDHESTLNEPYDTQAAVSRHRGWPNASDSTRWPLYTYRYQLREYFAEFFGTMILITFGDGVVATVTFNAGDSPATQSNVSYLAITFGWGIGLTIALYVSMGISGGSLNPAVTLANCFFGTFPWRKAPGYIIAQLLGAMVGAANVYGLFKDHFDKVKLAPGETMTDAVGGIFCTYPIVSTGSAVWSEILNSMLLMMGILGLINGKMTPAVDHRPIAVGLLVFVIGLSAGWNSGYAINPARDLGPRIVSAMIFGSSDPFTKADHYFWVPMLIPIVGTTLGFFLFTVFILPLRD